MWGLVILLWPASVTALYNSNEMALFPGRLCTLFQSFQNWSIWSIELKLSHLLATTVFREIQNTTPSKSILTHYSVITTQSLASSLNQSFFCKIFSFIEVLFFRQSNWTWNIKLCMLQLWHGLLLEWVMKRGKINVWIW